MKNIVLKKQTSALIAQELDDHRLCCKVYTLNVFTIQKNVFAVVDEFYKLSKWPKKQRKGKFLKEVKNFVDNILKWFDMYCENPKNGGH